ncbi:S41 family peptidase [Fulvivirga ligni]|uniref:S41 family peptidase n=1 Tax=Fulvivirga ligni TaxID=2904246 RepID=UPI001F1CFEAC|nr:S41 family peptidase [Fulvivirga ligni]UII20995.1 S41 family peptidase [Fulvivirga ligni]
MISKRILLFFTLFIPYFLQAQDKCTLPGKVVKTFEANHYQPRTLDDRLSQDIFELFIQNLDPDEVVFSSHDIMKLGHLKDQLDEAILADDCYPFNEILNAYDKRLSDIIIHIKNLQLADVSRFDKATFSIPTNHERSADINEVIDINIKQQYLQAKLNNDPLQKLSDHALFEAAKEGILCEYEQLKSPDKGLEEKLFSDYLMAIALSYDPHSLYLSPDDKELFNFDLSTEVLGYGFTLDWNMLDQLQVDETIPGTQVWAEGKIKKGDIVFRIIADGEVINLDCIDVDELNATLLQSSYKNIVVSLSHDNEKREIKLERGVIEQYDNTLNTLILEKNRKMAYIAIPSFYTAMDDRQRIRGLTDDMAKELISLRDEKIEGLILDLRFNGGGAIEEAIRLSGLFINEGPLFTLENRDREVNKVKDPTRGMAYDGPLLILVNEASASASEVFASTLQDYGRAIIVGSETYGKSTSQQTMPVIGTGNKHFVNVTREVLHRVTGYSYQGEGVIPDIPMEDVFKHLIIKENELKNYLRLRKLTSLTVERADLSLRQLEDSSAMRLSALPAYDSILAFNENLKEGRQFAIRLDESHYEEDIKNLNQWIVQLTSAGAIYYHNSFDVKIPEFAAFDVSLDEVLRRRYNEAKDDVETDLYVWESFNILSDFINLKTNK